MGRPAKFVGDELRKAVKKANEFFHEQNMSCDEIGKILGCSGQTIRKKLVMDKKTWEAYGQIVETSNKSLDEVIQLEYPVEHSPDNVQTGDSDVSESVA